MVLESGSRIGADQVDSRSYHGKNCESFDRVWQNALP